MRFDALVLQVCIGVWLLCGPAILAGWWQAEKRLAGVVPSNADALIGAALLSWLYVASPMIMIGGMLVDAVHDARLFH
jgi:hypothetical protein